MDIVPLSREQDRPRFDCGEPGINAFLHRGALQDQKLFLGRTSVLIDAAVDPNRILGYHTMLISMVDQDLIAGDRPRIRRKIPVILLGQLAVDLEFQGRNYSNWLLSDVETRTVDVAENVGIRALMLDARTESLACWYEKRDFQRFSDSLRMFKSVASIRALVR